jgi:hypothetical protein
MIVGLNFRVEKLCRSRARFEGQPRRWGFGKSVARCRARNFKSASSEEARGLSLLVVLLAAGKTKPLSSGIVPGPGRAAYLEHGLSKSQPGGGGTDAARSADLRPLLSSIVAQDDIDGNCIMASKEFVQ